MMDVTAIIKRFASLENRMERLEIEYGWRARAEAAEADARKSLEYADMLADKARELQAEINDLVLELSQEKYMRQAAEAEVARLRDARTLLSEVYNAFGYTWPQSFVEDVGAFLETSGQDAAGG
jgi:predicted RNase H-like nuclease (RuvC/YqgF family)